MTMRAVKRRKLHQRGWAVGDAGDLLELTAEERALVDLRLRLASGLKVQRALRRLTQGELAKAVKSSQSRVAKMEAGDPSVSIDLLLRSLIALGASRTDLARIITARNPLGTRAAPRYLVSRPGRKCVG
jgi:DNA-binding XRE family transcriptional regulator